jgi:hypothetical protein
MAMGAGRTVIGAQARRRWAVVLAVVVVLCSVPVVLRLWPARAAEVDPAVLRGRIAASTRQPYEGFAQSNGLLPLPALPYLQQVTALVSGTTQMRTWYAAPDRWRVDVIAGGSEHDLYQTPRAQYVWDYGDNQLTRIVGAQHVRLPRAADVTPPELVRRLLRVAAGDRLTPLAGKRVAGVAAAGLRLVPAAAGTTVAHVDIWADPGTGLPVQAEITARGGARPVFVTRFLDVRLGTPAAAVLRPPVPRDGMGYSVSTTPDVLSALNRWSVGSALPERLDGHPRRDVLAGATAVGIYGAGLAQFVVLDVPGRFGAAAYDDVATFGRRVVLPRGTAAVLATGLLSVLAVQADRTYLVAGFVDPAVLDHVAADLAQLT